MTASYHRSVTLTEELDIYLREHPEVNFSEMCRECLKRYIKDHPERDY
jgi:RNase adaptor protein for sRNA GlmZ degradation